MELVFLICLALVVYTFLGYGLIITIVNVLRKQPSAASAQIFTPEVTVVIAAYNEQDIIAAKIKNTLALDYPTERLKILVVADGSSDQTGEKAAQFLSVEVLHQPQRRGKTAALNRAMGFVKTPYVVFTDANAMLNPEALQLMMNHFANPKVGCVSGEKRVVAVTSHDGVGRGEGLYWRYESHLKAMDSKLYSAMGAAGELFALRTDAYQTQEENTILDDFMLSMNVLKQGKIIRYEPQAYAVETGSATFAEELKRKVRISAGGLQAVWRLKSWLLPFAHPLRWWMFVSHRVLRWTLAPVALLVMLPLNILLLNSHWIYTLLLAAQTMVYALAAFGFLQRKQPKLALANTAFYFLLMNYSVFYAIWSRLMGQNMSIWQKVQRS